MLSPLLLCKNNEKNQIMAKPKQSPEVKNLKAQLQRTDGVQLPPAQLWKNPDKVVIQSTKVVRGWGE